MLELLIALMLGLAVLVAVPLLILKAAFGLLGFVVALPFRILGALLHLAAGATKLVLGAVLLMVLVVLLPVLLVMLPAALGVCCILFGIKVLGAIF